MSDVTLILLLALPLALISAAVVRAMIAWPILDHPDARKAHTRPTPRGGGVGPVVAFILGMFAFYHLAALAPLAEERFVSVVVAAVAIAAVSLADDAWDFRFFVKLGAQALAAMVAMGAGLVLHRLSLPGFGEVPLGWLGYAITLFWIVGCTNAVNFMDGLDGLVGGVMVVACAALAAIAAANEGWFVFAAAVFLTAGFAGFLPFNLHPARIFMGDVGSQFAGFMLAVLAVAAGGFEASQVSFLIVPLLLFGLLYDASFTLIRRAAMGEKVSAPHRSHLYQMAQRSGMSVRWVAAVHGGFVLFHTALAFLFMGLAPADKPLVVLPALVLQLGWTSYVLRRMRRAGIGWR
ncbi:glycosyltransferase family 4 protein [Roseococcus sp. YIM B11640]|uniref:glycosyltransferase family 4 protein n=1 Tax=Roseococcus sp. YIM B11640 TaxID=3133973 RepID=UPI003C7C5C3A